MLAVRMGCCCFVTLGIQVPVFSKEERGKLWLESHPWDDFIDLVSPSPPQLARRPFATK